MENTKQKIVQLEHQRSYLTIVAPFDGEIDAILLYEGDLAASGKAILKMSNLRQRMLFSYAPANNNTIQKEQTVLMKGKEIGLVKSIYTRSKNGLVSAEVSLSQKLDLPTGSSVNIEVLTKEAHGCIVPSDSILHKKEHSYVMAYRETKFSPLEVNIEIQDTKQVLITPCPKVPLAQASEVKLAQLPAYDVVTLVGARDE
ncbi:MAG: hypothetical protein Q9M39_03605 [Sulfurovum sp.]|nr:hypothetical protein [Sulfurovum sp.]